MCLDQENHRNSRIGLRKVIYYLKYQIGLVHFCFSGPDFFIFILELTFWLAVFEKTSLWSIGSFVVPIPSHMGVTITPLSMMIKFSKVRFFSSSLTEGKGRFRSFSFLVVPENFGHELRGQMFGFQLAEFKDATNRVFTCVISGFRREVAENLKKLEP